MTPASMSSALQLRQAHQTRVAIRRAGSILLTLGALLFGTTSAAAPTRTILYNGKVFTADPAKPFAQAVAVSNDQIQAVGSNQSMLGLVRSNTRLIDLHGRTVVPGLNDAHVHVLTPPGTQLNGPEFIPGPGPTLAEVLGMVSAAASSTPPGTWLVVLVGSNITDDAGVNRAALDTVSPNHPVKLEVWTGHGTYINTKAMAVLGIGEQEPDPMGGHFERVPGSNVITGEAHEYAEHHIRRRQYAAMSNADAAARYQAFAAQALALGFTSLQDMAIGMPHPRAVEILKQAGLPLRVRSICIPLAVNEACRSSREGLESHPEITLGGLKWLTDGTPIERLAFLNEPYADQPDTRGEFNFSNSKLTGMLIRGLLGPRFQNQTLFHAVGDGSIDRILDGMEATGGHWLWSTRRTRIEHGDLLFAENFPRMRELGAVVVQNPTHFALTEVFSERLDPARFNEVEPLRALIDLGIPVAFGTDAIGNVQSPWVDIFFAAVHPTRPSQSVSVAEAITAYTRGSAYAEFEDDHKGTLAAGMKADLAVLSQDVFTVPVNALPATSSVLTMVDGQIAWQAPGPL